MCACVCVCGGGGRGAGYKLSLALARAVVTRFAPHADGVAVPLDPGSTAAEARPPGAGAASPAAHAAAGLSALDQAGFVLWLAACVWYHRSLMCSGPGPCARRFAIYLFAQACVSVGYLTGGPVCFLTAAAQVIAAHAYVLLYVAVSAGRWCAPRRVEAGRGRVRRAAWHVQARGGPGLGARRRGGARLGRVHARGGGARTGGDGRGHDARGDGGGVHVRPLPASAPPSPTTLSPSPLVARPAHAAAPATPAASRRYYAFGASLAVAALWRFHGDAVRSRDEARIGAARMGAGGGLCGVVVSGAACAVPVVGLLLSRASDSLLYVPRVLPALRAMDALYYPVRVPLSHALSHVRVPLEHLLSSAVPSYPSSPVPLLHPLSAMRVLCF